MFASKDIFLTAPSGGYNIARSVRLRSSATAYFNRTPSSAGNRKTFTWSGWVKRGTLSSSVVLFGADGTTTAGTGTLFYLYYDTDTLYIGADNTSGLKVQTSAVYRDISAWYHVVMAIDTTQATSSNRVKLYVNGVQVTAFSTATYPTQNREFNVNNTSIHTIGKWPSSSDFYFDGYLTEINFIDGQALTPSSFGSTNTTTGVWQPAKYTGTYGTNGFYLNFSDNSSNTATTIGKDYSGNGNNWTPNNISVTAGATYDSMQDVPTLTSATASNYAVLNPLYPSSTPVGGNLNVVGDSNSRTVAGTMSSSTGKWYAEGTFTSGYSVNGWFFVWDTSTPYVAGNIPATTGQTGAYYRGTNGNITKSVTGTTTSIGTYTTWTDNDIIGMAFDADAGTISFYKNNTLQVTITDSAFIGRPLTFGLYYYAGNASMNFGQRPFSYTPPTGYVALNTYNLPASTITNGAAYMNTLLYTGDGNTTKSITGLSFAPDFVWHKTRSNADDHRLVDIVRGGGTDLSSSILYSNLTNAQDNSSGYITQTSSGFDLGIAATPLNMSGRTYVAWNWKANGAGASNTNGTITSTVSAGATQGFSVVTFTAPSSGNFSAGHGLGVTPGMVITKVRGRVTSWITWHNQLNSGSPGTTYYIELNSTGGQSTFANVWGSTGVTSSVIGMGVGASCAASDTIVAYCFAPVAGYSAFGSYTGNGSTDGPFVYTGFRPRWVMWKNSSTGGTDWTIIDSSRNTYNVANSGLQPNGSYAEASNSNYQIDFLSNGFKLRTTNAEANQSGISIIYAAFAENPMKYALAR
jgi:hypothetical protein